MTDVGVLSLGIQSHVAGAYSVQVLFVLAHIGGSGFSLRGVIQVYVADYYFLSLLLVVAGFFDHMLVVLW